VLTPAQAKLGPLTGPANLMMFVYPKRETRYAWQSELAMIRGAFSLFDGLRLLWIATDDSTAEGEIDLTGWTAVATGPNDPQQRELPGWRWAMGLLKSEPGFTVRLHAKGAWRGTAEQHLARWWELGYERLLDVDRVRESLQSHVITGPFRRNVPAVNLGTQWHYSGSLYAFRNAEIFVDEWEPAGKVDPGWYVEAWPALVAPRELAGSVGWDGVGDLYQAKAWRHVPQTAVVNQQLTTELTQETKIDETPQVIAFPAMPRQKKPAVSIIVPAWNEATRIEKCLRSLVAQTFTDFEVIIVDDGSTDETSNIVRQLISDDGRFSLITKEHSGIGNTLNAGFARACADLQTWTSADSWVFPEYLAILKAALEVNPAAVMAYSDWKHVDGDKETIVREPDFNRKELQASCRIGVCWLFRRSAKEQAGPYVAEPCEDYYMHLMLAGIGDFVHVPEVLGVWRNHPANTSTRTCNPSKWVHSVTVKAKARWQQAKYRVAYVCPNLDAASVGWLHASVFNDISSDFAVRHILGDVTHVTPGIDLRLRVQNGDYPIEDAARQAIHEADIIHINSAFPDADSDLWEIVKGKPLVIHHHATRQQRDAETIRRWKEAGTPVLTCTPGHPLATWIPNAMPINPAFPMQYDSFYQPAERDWSRLKILCHHNYESGKGVAQIQDIIDGMDEIRFGGRLRRQVDLSLSTEKKTPII
jgi:hypothetical protein